MWLLNLKKYFYLIRKNSHNRILKEESKEQHLSTVHKSYSFIYIYIYIYGTSKKIKFKICTDFSYS